MKHFTDGFRLIVKDRSLWPFIWRPLLWTAGVFLLIVLLGWFLIVPWVTHRIEDWGWAESIGWLGGSVIYIAIWFFLSGPVFLALAGLLSSILWEDLGAAVEAREFGSAATYQLTKTEWVADTIFRGIFSVVIAGLTLIIGWTCVGVTGVFLAAWLGLLDYSSGAFIRRGTIFPTQNVKAWSCPGWFSFSIVAGLATLIPVVNVLLFPALVAGGTLLCARRFPPTASEGLAPQRTIE